MKFGSIMTFQHTSGPTNKCDQARAPFPKLPEKFLVVSNQISDKSIIRDGLQRRSCYRYSAYQYWSYLTKFAGHV